MNNRFLKVSLLAASLAGLGACASHGTPPNDLLIQVESDISQAENMNANEYAPVALRNAKQYLMAAKKHIEEEDYDTAKQDLEKAMVDAEYALVASNSKKSQMAASEIKSQIDTLKKEVSN